MLEEVQPVCVGIDPLYLPVGDRRSLEASRDARWASPVASPAAGTSVSDAPTTMSISMIPAWSCRRSATSSSGAARAPEGPAYTPDGTETEQVSVRVELRGIVDEDDVLVLAAACGRLN